MIMALYFQQQYFVIEYFIFSENYKQGGSIENGYAIWRMLACVCRSYPL